MVKKKQDFPTLMEPPRLNSWWFWGALGLGAAIWGGAIWGVSQFI